MIIMLDLKYLYVTNIAEGGTNAIVTYDKRKCRRMDCRVVNTKRMVPHNPKTTVHSERIFSTHSRATSEVGSVTDIRNNGCPLPATGKLVKTGLNLFGICLLPPAAPAQPPSRPQFQYFNYRHVRSCSSFSHLRCWTSIGLKVGG